jgi:hypothetical protein
MRSLFVRRTLACVVLAAILGSLPSCSARPRSAALETGPVAPRARLLADAIAAERSASDALLAIPGVAGIGVSATSGDPAVLVLLVRPGAGRIPARIGAIPVVTEVVGTLRPFALGDRYRPVPIGVSAGNANECLPGTIGCVLETGRGRFALSANHVFARQNRAAPGESIVQPSRADSDPSCGPAPPTTMVARLTDFEPVVYDGTTPNQMDAAIAELTTESSCATLPAFYGLPSSQPAAARLDLAVLKVGRTTELTRGSLKAIDVKVKITFPSGTAKFVGQLLTSKDFGSFGDSGSLVVTDDGEHHPVGMVIGGGSNGSAIVTPIGAILDRFHATVCGR